LHEGQGLLGELALVGAVAVAAMLVLHRIRVPAFGGLLVGGAIAGPTGLGLIGDVQEIQEIAEIGVILLLFSIGLEFSMARLRFIWRAVSIGGSLQVGLTAGAVLILLLALGDTLERGILFGSAVALSSTAIVLRALSERGELDAPHGRFIVGTLLFQDLLVVPLTLLVPLLGEAEEGTSPLAILGALLVAMAGVLLVAAVARLAIPVFFQVVAATKSREIFLLAVLSVGIGAAWVMSALGLSVALGAFLAGMILADTEYRHRAMSELIPLRDAFGSLFFISLGLLFDWRALVDDPVPTLLVLAGLVLGKAVIATLVAMVGMRYPAGAAWRAGVSLAQFGEFGFVVLLLGVGEGLATTEEIRLLVTAGVMSMLLSRLAIAAAPSMRAGEAVLRPLERLLRVRGADEMRPEDEGLSGHVVVVGYGVAGQLLAASLKSAGRPYLVLELDAERVRQARRAGEPVYYGDITSPETLNYTRVRRARALVLLINDPEAVRRALEGARSFVPSTPIIARTRYVREREELLRLGADYVVCEELEAGAEIAAHVLRALGMEGGEIYRAVENAIMGAGHASITGERQSWLVVPVEVSREPLATRAAERDEEAERG
jgi:CPA2 family monovalent cation:H+ antiporter-2